MKGNRIGDGVSSWPEHDSRVSALGCYARTVVRHGEVEEDDDDNDDWVTELSL